MHEYRLDSERYDGEIKQWHVWSGRVSYGDFIKEEIVYSSESIADCYAWISAKKEGLMLLK